MVFRDHGFGLPWYVASGLHVINLIKGLGYSILKCLKVSGEGSLDWIWSRIIDLFVLVFLGLGFLG